MKRCFRNAGTCQVPLAYTKLWEAGISGLINLNIDRLGTRAFAQVTPETLPNEFVGTNVKAFASALKSPRHFIANVHGVYEDASSFVFCNDDLRYLLKLAGYKEFITSCLLTKTVMFVGISADDVAAGGHLSALTSHKIDAGDHFWITHRNDASTQKWAEVAGIQIVHYNAPNDDHSELLELLDDLKINVSVDKPERPVVPVLPSSTSSMPLPSPEHLERESAETIRQALNQHATELLSGGDPARYERYKDFILKYDESVYRAWRVSTDAPRNHILGYKLTDEIAEGAFGTVYSALDPQGKVVALKVLHESVRKKAEMLQGFRRGVRSMKILSNNKVPGAVTYHAATEIPAMVVMDYIAGPNLLDAVSKRIVANWQDILWVAKELSGILQRAHGLPDRVLHRDVRPANVMIENGWNAREEWKLVVLDFDLSWHRESFEVSVVHPGSGNGYLAPEQVKRNGASTRSALVDSFGLGMTLFYSATGVEPGANAHMNRDWLDNLETFASTRKCFEWNSLPFRFFRLIGNATQDEQHKRWDMTQIHTEIVRLREALLSPSAVDSAELLAEELTCRATDGRYRWNEDNATATHENLTGLKLMVSGRESDEIVTIELGWMQRNPAEYSSITRWIGPACAAARQELVAAGFDAVVNTAGMYQASVGCQISLPALRGGLKKMAEGLSGAISRLSFSGV